MNIDLDVYIACRIALAMAILAEPNNARHRAAYLALHASLAAETEGAIAGDSMPSTRQIIAESYVPVLTRVQA